MISLFQMPGKPALRMRAAGLPDPSHRVAEMKMCFLAPPDRCEMLRTARTPRWLALQD
jgi:hypothetical protein